MARRRLPWNQTGSSGAMPRSDDRRIPDSEKTYDSTTHRTPAACGHVDANPLALACWLASFEVPSARLVIRTDGPIHAIRFDPITARCRAHHAAAFFFVAQQTAQNKTAAHFREPPSPPATALLSPFSQESASVAWTTADSNRRAAAAITGPLRKRQHAECRVRGN